MGASEPLLTSRAVRPLASGLRALDRAALRHAMPGGLPAPRHSAGIDVEVNRPRGTRRSAPDQVLASA